MNRVRLLLIGLPIIILCTDILNLFTSSPPPKPTHHHDDHDHDHGYYPPSDQYQSTLKQQHILQEPLPFPPQQKSITNFGHEIDPGIGSTVYIAFCTSCSYKGIAITMKNMLEAAYPGINVILANHPPALPKRLLSKAVLVVQVGITATIMAGEQIFPRFGIMTPPPWYHSLRANRFGSIASVWFFGNFLQSSLQSTGAFEVYCNGEFVFSKLKEHRFPAELELRDLVGRKLINLRNL